MKHILNALVVLLFLSSCEFEPHGKFERNLNQNTEAPEIYSEELDLSEEKDTLILLYPRVYFNFSSSNQNISYVNFFINDSLVGTADSGNGSCDLNYSFSYDSYYKLRLEIFTHSGTGSIADSLKVEGYMFNSKQWVIKVLNRNINTLTSTVQDGFLKLRWIMPNSPNIKEYVIFR
jgi:hypothetical protein